MSLPISSGKEPLTGYRGWSLAQPGFLITSNMVWLAGERTEAACSRIYNNHEDMPGDTCSCGIYAFKWPELIHSEKYSYQDVLGEVWLWGKVIEHEKGFKAQYAYPKSINLKPDANRYLTQLAEYVAFKYQVPLGRLTPEDAMLAETPKARAQAEANRLLAEKAKREAAIAKRMSTRAGNQALEKRAAAMPATDPRFKNMLEQINYEAAQEVKRRTQK